MVLTGVGLKLDVWLGVVFTKSNLVVVWRGRVLNYKINGRFYAVFTSMRCNDVFKNTVGFVAKHVIICNGPLTFLDPKCGALVFAKPPMWIRGWRGLQAVVDHLPKSIIFLTYVLPIESNNSCMLHPPHKKFSESPNKKMTPPVLKEPENNNSFVGAIFEPTKDPFSLTYQPGSRLTFVAFQAPFSLIPLLVGWNIGGQKKNGQMPTRKKTGQSLRVFLVNEV